MFEFVEQGAGGLQIGGVEAFFELSSGDLDPLLVPMGSRREGGPPCVP